MRRQRDGSSFEANMPVDGVRRRLINRVRDLRPRDLHFATVRSIRYVESDRYLTPDGVRTRLRVIIRTGGCCVPNCTMCALPNLGAGKVEDSEILRGLSEVLAKHPGHEVVAIYNDGNFFADNEIGPNLRNSILDMVASYGCSMLMVESLPAFVTAELIDVSLVRLGSVRLCVAFGLQSVNEQVRKFATNTPLYYNDFVRCTELLAQREALCKVYLLIKPPFLTEPETVADVAASANAVSGLVVHDLSLCPCRVVPGTVAHDLLQIGQYTPPRLSTIGHCVAAAQASGVPTRVSLVNISTADADGLVSQGCIHCQDRILNQLNRVNLGARPGIEALTCMACDQAFATERLWNLPLEHRVQRYLDMCNLSSRKPPPSQDGVK